MLFTEVREGRERESVRSAFVVENRRKENETKNDCPPAARARSALSLSLSLSHLFSSLLCPPGALNGQIELGSQQLAKKRCWKEGREGARKEGREEGTT